MMSYGPVIDPDLCTHCYQCVDMCPMDVFQAESKSRDIPSTTYVDECWYCGVCVTVCPSQPCAINLVHPLNMRLALKKVK